MNDTPPPTIDETIVERFEASWLRGDPKPIEGLNLDRNAPYYLATLEELVHLDLEFAWKPEAENALDANDPAKETMPVRPRVEQYFARFPELNDGDVALRLLKQEYLVRCRFGDQPSKEEYRERFPEIVRTGDEVISKDAIQPKKTKLSKEPELQTGTEIGRYVLIDEEGRGGFGRVWQVEDPKLGRRIALKQLSDRAAREEDLRRRFVAEARISARLEHPGVVPVYDLDQLDERHPFYTMKLVKGQTLAEAIGAFHAGAHVSTSQPMEFQKLLGIFVSVCRTMEYCHASGVIHRDLKPQNIIVGDYGETIVLDWGLAKLVSDDGEQSDTPVSSGDSIGDEAVVTQEGSIQGTPAYMSPEQAAGRIEEVDHRSDIYSLGTILYQLLTGRLPFEDRSGGQLLLDVQNREPPRPRSILAEIPLALEAICLKAMAKARADRYQRVAELTHDMERFVADEPVTAYPEPWTTKARRWASRHRTLVTAAGAAVAVMLVSLIVGVLLLADANRRERALAAKETAARELAQKKQNEADDARDAAQTSARRANKEKNEALRQRERADRSLYAARMLLGQQMWNTGAGDELRRILEVTRPGSAQEDYRGWEWFYFQSLVHRDSWTIRNESYLKKTPIGAVMTSVAWSPDGRILALAGDGFGVRLLDGDTGDQLRVLSTKFEIMAMTSESLTWSPNGNMLAWYDQAWAVKIYQRDEPAPKKFEKVSKVAGLGALSWGPDSGQLAMLFFGSDTRTEIWDLNGEKPVASVKWDHLLPYAMAWSPDGRTIAAAGLESGESGIGLYVPEGTLQIADAAGGKLLHTYRGHTDQIMCVDWSPDSKRVVTGSEDGSIIIWNAETGEKTPMLGGHDACVFSAAFSSDGRRIATGGGDRMIKVWNADNGAPFLTLRGHGGTVRSVGWGPDGRRLVSASEDGTVKVWDACAAQECFDLKVPSDEPTRQYRAWKSKWSRDSRHLAVLSHWLSESTRSRDHKLSLLEPETGLSVVEWPVGNATVSFAWSADAHQFAYLLHQTYPRKRDGSSEEPGVPAEITVWDLTKREVVHQFDVTTEYPAAVCFSPNLGQLAIVGNPSGKLTHAGDPLDTTIAVWDVASSKQLSELKGHSKGIVGLVWGPQEKYLASCDADAEVRVWDMDQRAAVHTFSAGEPAGRPELVWSPNGRQLAWCGDEAVIWSIADGRELRRFADAWKVSWSPSGDRLLAIGETGMSILNASSWERLATLEVDPELADDFAWSPDGKRVAFAVSQKSRGGLSDRGEVRIWDTATGQPVITLLGDRANSLYGLRWSPDGRRISTVSQNGPIKIWDASVGYALESSPRPKPAKPSR